MGLNTVYKARSFDLSGLTGISDETLAMHFKLYEGYVTNTNLLNEQINGLIGGGQLDPTKVAAFSRAPPAVWIRVQRHGPARVLLREHEEAGHG